MLTCATILTLARTRTLALTHSLTHSLTHTHAHTLTLSRTRTHCCSHNHVFCRPFEKVLQWDEFSIRLPEHRLEELPAILSAIPAEKVAWMQNQVVHVYEAYFSSLAQQVYTTVEQIRLELFTPPGDYDEELKSVRRLGLPHPASPLHAVTPAAVQQDSIVCNSPPHRRAKVKDNAIMR